MQTDLAIHNINTSPIKSGKTDEQRFEDNLNDHLNSTGRDPLPSNDIQNAVSKIKSQTMSPKDVVKLLLNTSNSSDVETVTQLLQENNLLPDPTPTPEKAQQKQNEVLQQNLQNTKQNAAAPMNQLSIIQTPIEQQLLVKDLLSQIKSGKGSDALKTCTDEPELVDDLLDSLSKNPGSNDTEIHSSLGFIQQLSTFLAPYRPEVAERARRAYKRIKLNIEGKDEATDCDLSSLSTEAQSFIHDLNALADLIRGEGQELPDDIGQAYNELVSLLGGGE